MRTTGTPRLTTTHAQSADPAPDALDPGPVISSGHQQTSSKRTQFWRRRQAERESVEAGAHVLHIEVAVDLRGDPRVGVPEDLLDRGERHPGLEKERRCRVAQVVEAERLRFGHRPEPHLAVRAPAGLGVGQEQVGW